MKRYRLGKTLGSGSYAVVRVCKDIKTGDEYAVKVYEKYKLLESHRKKNLRREIKILNKLDHPHIIKLHKTIETSR